MSSTTPRKAKYVQMGDVRLPIDHRLEQVQQAVDYNPAPDDVFIVSYPRSGDCWLQKILLLLLTEGQIPIDLAEDAARILLHSPLIEFTGSAHFDQLPRPALIKSHLPYSYCPMADHTRYIYIARNVKDVCVNYYYDNCLLPQYDFEGDFDEFFTCFAKGEVAYGDYYDHVLGWFQRRHQENVLFLVYEDFVHDPVTHLLELAAFLGEDYLERLKSNPDMLEDVLEFSSLPFMGELAAIDPYDTAARTEYIASQAKDPIYMGSASIMGNYRFMLSSEQEDILKEILIERNRNNDLPYLWYDHGIF